MATKEHAPARGCLAALAAAAVLAGCSPHGASRPAHSPAAIKARGTLVVLTRNAPTTYYIGRNDRPSGPEYEMASAFARSLGVKARFVMEDSVEAMLQALADGKGDLVAGGITRTHVRTGEFDFGPAYQTVRQQIVCRRGGPRPATIDDLGALDLEVIADSSYVERLRALRKRFPKLEWKAVPDVGTETLLRRVWKGRVDCTVADSDIVAINRRYFPNLQVAFDLTGPQSLAWVLPRGAKALRNALDRWFAHYRGDGELADVMDRYYAHARVFDYVDMRTYVRRIRSVYPHYRRWFHAAASRYGVPPLVLAAQAYQESHWKPHAHSPTGVRGMMMLTRHTARALGVHNRLDARASIFGGARYLAKIETRLPAAVDPADRIWFALAAYNIGYQHLRDARLLARRLGKNPDDWTDLRTVLPLLAHRRYYRHLPHGYARGLEPVRYVRRIRNYADVLREHVDSRSAMRRAPARSPYGRETYGLPRM